MQTLTHLNEDTFRQVVTDHPCPWRLIEKRSGIVVKDAMGMTILFLAFTGKVSRDRKRRTAQLIAQAVNQTA